MCMVWESYLFLCWLTLIFLFTTVFSLSFHFNALVHNACFKCCLVLFVCKMLVFYCCMVLFVCKMLVFNAVCLHNACILMLLVLFVCIMLVF